MKLLEECLNDLIRVNKTRLVNHCRIAKFVYKKSKQRKSTNFWVCLTKVNLEEVFLRIGESNIPSLLSNLPPNEKQRFESVLTAHCPELLNRRPPEAD